MTNQKEPIKGPIVDTDPIASWDDEGGAAPCGDQSTCKLHERPEDEAPHEGDGKEIKGPKNHPS